MEIQDKPFLHPAHRLPLLSVNNASYSQFLRERKRNCPVLRLLSQLSMVLRQRGSPRHFSASLSTPGHLPVPSQKPPTLILNTIKSSEMRNFLQSSLQLSECLHCLVTQGSSVVSPRGVEREEGRHEEEGLLACMSSSLPAPAHTHLSLLLSL